LKRNREGREGFGKRRRAMVARRSHDNSAATSKNARTRSGRFLSAVNRD
jgi:hypothetical protein